MAAWLPQLVGDHYAVRNLFRNVPILRIAKPLVPTDVLRASPSQLGALGAVHEHERMLRQPLLPAPSIAPAFSPVRALGTGFAAGAPFLQPHGAPPPRFRPPPLSVVFGTASPPVDT